MFIFIGSAAQLAIAKQWEWAGKFKELKYGCECFPITFASTDKCNC